MKLRVLSFNVNGLRTLCNLHGGLLPLLESLNADIICFQEHKLRRDDLDPSIAIVPGWESFFAFNRTQNNKGYSGVCTFVKRSIGIPLDAEEGMTGLLALDKSIPKSKTPSLLGAPWESYTAQDLESIEAEGRCLITDHGAFVLFNIYGPAITSDSQDKAEERSAYKRTFFTALELRLRQALAAGRRLLLLGDLNICPSPADTRDPTYTDDRFYTESSACWARSWLRSLTGNHRDARPGPFRDTFRLFHPTRAQAFTCWQTASGARVNNWGSRIDLVLAADGRDVTGRDVYSWVVGGDIMPEVQGSDHCPVWAELELQQDLPSAAAIPRASARFLFDSATAKQATLMSFFGRLPQQSAEARQELVSAAAAAGSASTANGQICALLAGGAASSRECGSDVQASASRQQESPGCGQQQSNACRQLDQAHNIGLSASACLGVAAGAETSNSHNHLARYAAQKHAGAQKRPAPQQLSMRSFLPPKPPPQPSPAAALPQQQPPGAAQQPRTQQHAQQQAISMPCDYDEEDDNDDDEGDGGGSSASAPERIGSQSSGGEAASAAASWNFGRAPRCRHNEPAVARTVKKKCVNRGREFYCCARPDGPKPQGRCDFFKWRYPQASDKKQRVS